MSWLMDWENGDLTTGELAGKVTESASDIIKKVKPKDQKTITGFLGGLFSASKTGKAIEDKLTSQKVGDMLRSPTGIAVALGVAGLLVWLLIKRGR